MLISGTERKRQLLSYLRIIHVIHVMCSHRCRYLLPQPPTAATSREPNAGQDNERRGNTRARSRHRIIRKAKSLRSRALERRGGHGMAHTDGLFLCGIAHTKREVVAVAMI